MKTRQKKRAISKMRFVMIIVSCLLLLIQLIRQEKNTAVVPPGKTFLEKYMVDTKVASLLRTSCFDCHSNNSRYPWYSAVQPIGWFMGKHISEGKEKLNFDELSNYGTRKRRSKFSQIANQIKADKMPLVSYRWIHHDAKLNDTEKQTLINYFTSLANM